MKIVLITAAEKFGGAEVYVQGLANTLLGSDIEVKIVCGKCVASHFEDLFEDGIVIIDNDIVWDWNKSSESNIVSQQQCINKLSVILGDFVAFVNLNWLNVCCGVISELELLGIKSVIHTHLCPYKLKLTPLETDILRKSVHSSAWSAVSFDNKRHILSTLNLNMDQSADRIEVIYNGAANTRQPFDCEGDEINSSKIQSRRKLNLSSDSKVVLTVGRHDRQKGFEDALFVFQRVTAFVPNIRYLWVGGGDLLRIHERMIKMAGLEEVILLIDHTKEIEEYYMAGDLYYMPTKYEGFSLAMLEAAYFKMPMLINDVSSSREFIPPKLEFCLANPLNLWDHIFKMQWLLSSDIQFQKNLGVSLRQKADEFSQEIMYETMRRRVVNVSLSNASGEI